MTDFEDLPTNPGFKHDPSMPLRPPDFTSPKFPHEPGHKSLEQLAMEAPDKDPAVLLVDAFSRIPYRIQLWIIRVRLFIEGLML